MMRNLIILSRKCNELKGGRFKVLLLNGLFNFIYKVFLLCLKKVYFENLRGKNGLEIGGPSEIFRKGRILPVYPIIKGLDGCNFNTQTIWEGKIKEGLTFKYQDERPVGYQFICEAVDLSPVGTKKYDFVLSSHALEHIANPLKALSEWLRVLKDDGFILLVVPHKDGTFDRRRPVTSLNHLIEDFENNTGENDLTHLPEILALHDLRLDPPARDFDYFKERSLNNFENRCLHHHVFDPELVIDICKYFDLQVIALNLALPYHIIVMARKK